MEKRHSINTVSKISGLQPLVIRTWENRYSVVKPARSKTNHRLYSDDDVERLTALKKLTMKGYKIGDIAFLPMKEINNLLIKDDIASKSPKENKIVTEQNPFSDLILKCIERIKEFDSKGFEKLLAEAMINNSFPTMVDNIIIPLVEKIGDYWKGGEFRISHEHFTSSIIRKILSNISDGYNIQKTAPKLTVTTPHGQYHELSALIGAALAASDGWRITYLGPGLPAEEIAFTMKQTGSEVLFLSIVYPNDDLLLITELKKIRELTGNKTHIIVSGSSVNGYINILSEINANVVTEPRQFRKLLSRVRNLMLNNHE